MVQSTLLNNEPKVELHVRNVSHFWGAWATWLLQRQSSLVIDSKYGSYKYNNQVCELDRQHAFLALIISTVHLTTINKILWAGLLCVKSDGNILCYTQVFCLPWVCCPSHVETVLACGIWNCLESLVPFLWLRTLNCLSHTPNQINHNWCNWWWW